MEPVLSKHFQPEILDIEKNISKYSRYSFSSRSECLTEKEIKFLLFFF